MAAALRVFSTHGFAGATNQLVANEAGVKSAGLIYHYFASKEDLLRAVAERYAPPLRLLERGEEIVALPPREGLTLIGQAYLSLLDDEQFGRCVTLIWGEALRNPPLAATIHQVGPRRLINLVENFLDRKMGEGLLRRADVHITARLFIWPFMGLLLSRRLFGPDFNPFESKAMLETHVELFLQGIAAPSQNANTGRSTGALLSAAPEAVSERTTAEI